MTVKSAGLDRYLLATIVVLIMLFFFRECSLQKDKDDLFNQVLNYKDSAQQYKLKVKGHDVEVSYNRSLILENKKQLEAMVAKNDTLSALIEKFSTIRSTTIIKEYIKIDQDTLFLNQPIPCDFDPISISRDSLYYQFYGTIAPDYFSIDSLIIPNEQSIVIGEKRLGMFKGKEQRIEIVNSNPLMRTTNIGNFVIQENKKWYQRTWFKIGIGVLGGAIIGNQILR